MTKEELVSELAGRANLTRRAAAAAIDNLLDIVVERAAKGEETQVLRPRHFQQAYPRQPRRSQSSHR